MSKATDGAKGCKGMSVKPDANNPKADCPCDEFLHCSTRIPYGANMWSNGNRRKKAISKISYQINSGRFDLIKRIGKSIDKKPAPNPMDPNRKRWLYAIWMSTMWKHVWRN